MEAAWNFASAHPFLTFAVVIASLAIILFAIFGSAEDKSDNSLGVPADEKHEEETPKMTKITILAGDGKVLEELIVESDCLVWSGNYFRYTDKAGNEVVYLTGNSLVKIVEL